MTTKKTGNLDVPGASLYYEIYGSGPTLLMISPGLGDCGFYSQVAEILSDEYLVLTYDRRGNSRSKEKEVDPSSPFTVAEHSDDARRVLEAFGEAPAYVFGGSGGAIITLDFTARFPELVRTAIAHEPPLITLLPEAERLAAATDEIYEMYRREGAYPAMAKFGETFDGTPQQEPDLEPDNPVDPSIQQRLAGNFDVLLGREMLPFTRYVPDLAALRRGGRRIVLGGGEKSADAPAFRSGLAVSERLETEFVVFPGDHPGYLTWPRPFAARLREVLSRR